MKATRKIGDICQRIDKVPLDDEFQKRDADLFQQFSFNAMCTRFSLDCLSKSMLYQKPIYPEVLPIIFDGLRSAVNAHAWARRALDLRIPEIEPQIAPVEWDDEDQQLMDEASHDVRAEPV